MFTSRVAGTSSTRSFETQTAAEAWIVRTRRLTDSPERPREGLSSALVGLIQRIQSHNVSRVDPIVAFTLIADDFRQPNGIYFAPNGGG